MYLFNFSKNMYLHSPLPPLNHGRTPSSGHDLWPKVIEAEESSLAESLNNMCLGAGLIWTKKAAKEAEANKHAVPKNRVKISACTEPSRGPEGTTDVIVYPEVCTTNNVRYVRDRCFFFVYKLFSCVRLRVICSLCCLLSA